MCSIAELNATFFDLVKNMEGDTADRARVQLLSLTVPLTSLFFLQQTDNTVPSSINLSGLLRVSKCTIFLKVVEKPKYIIEMYDTVLLLLLGLLLYLEKWGLALRTWIKRSFDYYLHN